MTGVAVQLWLPLKITGLSSIQAVILHFVFGYWEFCDYLFLILARMLILYLMTLSEGGVRVCICARVCVCLCVCVHVVGEVVRVELISSLALFSHSCFLIKRN